MLSPVGGSDFCHLLLLSPFFSFLAPFFLTVLKDSSMISLSNETSCFLEVGSSLSFLNQCLSEGGRNMCMTYKICLHNDECLVRTSIIKIETRLQKAI